MKKEFVTYQELVPLQMLIDIAKNPQICVTDISKIIKLPMGEVIAILDDLDHKHLIKRRRWGTDRRFVTNELSSQGKKWMKALGIRCPRRPGQTTN